MRQSRIGFYHGPERAQPRPAVAPSGSARDLTGWVGDLFPVGVSRDGRSMLAGLGCGGIPISTGSVKQVRLVEDSTPRLERSASRQGREIHPLVGVLVARA